MVSRPPPAAARHRGETRPANGGKLRDADIPLLNPSATGTRTPPIPQRTPEGFRRRRRASGNGVTVRRQTHSSPGITMAYSPARRSVETTPVFQSRISVGKWLLRARDRRVRRGNGMNDGNAIKRASSTEGTGIIGRNMPEPGVGGWLPPGHHQHPARIGPTRRVEPHCGSATRSSVPYDRVRFPRGDDP